MVAVNTGVQPLGPCGKGGDRTPSSHCGVRSKGPLCWCPLSINEPGVFAKLHNDSVLFKGLRICKLNLLPSITQSVLKKKGEGS